MWMVRYMSNVYYTYIDNDIVWIFILLICHFTEWALQCECDLKVSDEMYQMIDNYAENQCTMNEAMKSGLSAILIKGRNTKFAVIK